MTIDIFKKRLTEFRKKNHLTQKEIAEKIGVTAATFSAYENGKNMPTAQILAKLSEEYGVSIDWLLGVENNKPKTKTYADLLRLFNDIFNTLSIDKFSIDGKKHIIYFRDQLEDSFYYHDNFMDALNKLYSLYKMKKDGNVAPDLYESVVSTFYEKYEDEIQYGIFVDGQREETFEERCYREGYTP